MNLDELEKLLEGPTWSTEDRGDFIREMKKNVPKLIAVARAAKEVIGQYDGHGSTYLGDLGELIDRL